jgi:ketosteroid isomerase-like protein
MISKILTLIALGTLASAFTSAQTAAKSTAPRPATKAAPKSAPQNADTAIRAVLERQQTDWNRGDTEGFLLGYDDSAIFVGDKISKGLEELRVRYQSHYPTRAYMGHLTFSDLDIHAISAEYSYVIGRWRLERKPEDGGDTEGTFTLLFKHTARGWKIVLDHTS